MKSNAQTRRDDGQDKALTKVDLEVALPVTETILGQRVRE